MTTRKRTSKEARAKGPATPSASKVRKPTPYDAWALAVAKATAKAAKVKKAAKPAKKKAASPKAPKQAAPKKTVSKRASPKKPATKQKPTSKRARDEKGRWLPKPGPPRTADVSLPRRSKQKPKILRNPKGQFAPKDTAGSDERGWITVSSAGWVRGDGTTAISYSSLRDRDDAKGIYDRLHALGHDPKKWRDEAVAISKECGVHVQEVYTLGMSP